MPEPENDTRPGLAFVSNSVAPYRVNLQRLIAAGIPELKFHALITHGVWDFEWNVDIPPEINLARFGAQDEHPTEHPLRRPLWGWRKGGRLIRYVRENHVQAVILYGYNYISYLRLMNYCDRHGIPMFMNADNNIRREPSLSALRKFAKRRIYAWWTKRVSGVMSMGALGDQFFLKYGADPARMYRVPCWPDYDLFTHIDEFALVRFRQKFRLDERRRYLLFSGRLVPDKRVDLLIDAFVTVANSRPEWDLLIVGDGVLREDLHRRVPEALRQRVVWTGFLEGNELASAFHASDVLVLPSDNDAWALVIQEAMAAGLTVVSSDTVGAAYEIVVDGVSGKIFPAGNCDLLRQSLEEVTRADRLNNYKAEAVAALQRYREKVDPVAEIRRALFDAGVLSSAHVGSLS